MCDTRRPAHVFQSLVITTLFALCAAIAQAAPLDTDHDSLPDAWETAHGRDPLVADYQIAVGNQHTCVLDDSGVQCWGSNQLGQTDVPVLVNPKQISGGAYSNHFCAVDDVGAHCWGVNVSGQTDVPVLVNPRQVSVGEDYSCALDDVGVHCWGDNRLGQTDVPYLSNPASLSSGGRFSCAIDDTGLHCWGPAPNIGIPVLVDPVQVSVGGWHACAIDDTGPHCWGANWYGQLDVPALSNPMQVISGGVDTCAIDDVGLQCWGADFYGQDDAINMPLLNNPVQVSMGEHHICALDDNGVHCWGSNSNGETSVPELAMDPDGDGMNNAHDDFPLDSTKSGDMDGDSIDNHIDLDIDGDGTFNSLDSCVFVVNPDQADIDSDGSGDACDSNNDNDFFYDGSDNCPLNANNGQEDIDGDGMGDVCDDDIDSDAVLNAVDNCPLNQNADQLDNDSDGAGDVCDAFPTDYSESLDSDADYFGDNIDNCPLDWNGDQIDNDGDGIGDACDATPMPFAGHLDIDFLNIGLGANGYVLTSVIQSDGKILIGGEFTTFNDVTRNHIARLNADGTLDLTFDPGVGPNGSVHAMAIKNDGKILIGGAFTSVSNADMYYYAHLNSDGSLDNTASTGDVFDGPVNTIVLQADNKIVIAGDFTTFSGVSSSRKRILRLNVDGSVDGSFTTGLGADAAIRAVILQEDGKLLVGGDFTVFHKTSCNKLARLNSNGTVDTTFNNVGTGADGSVHSLALQADGKIFMGGMFANYNDISRNYLARINADGTLDSSFNPDLNGEVNAMAERADGKLVIAGNFTSVLAATRNRLALLNSDGTLDATFIPAAGADAAIYTASLQANGELLIGGAFTTYNGVSSNHLARIHSGDTDGDGVDDYLDAFPTNAAAAVDVGHDGIPDAWLEPNIYGCTAFDESCNGLTITQDPPNVIYPLNGVYKGSSISEFSGWR